MSDGSFIEVTSGSEKGPEIQTEAPKDEPMAAFHESRPRVIYDSELERANRRKD